MGILIFSPERRMKRKYQATLKQAMEKQRSGDIQASSILYAQADEMQKKLEELSSCPNGK